MFVQSVLVKLEPSVILDTADQICWSVIVIWIMLESEYRSVVPQLYFFASIELSIYLRPDQLVRSIAAPYNRIVCMAAMVRILPNTARLESSKPSTPSILDFLVLFQSAKHKLIKHSMIDVWTYTSHVDVENEKDEQ